MLDHPDASLVAFNYYDWLLLCALGAHECRVDPVGVPQVLPAVDLVAWKVLIEELTKVPGPPVS